MPRYVIAANRYRCALVRSEALRAEYVAALVAARADGVSVARLAADLNVDRSRVYQILQANEEG